MNEEYYMQQVELILDMHEVADERVDKISKLSLPDDASPLAILIHGDSRQLLEATKYAQQDDPYTPSVEEVQKLRKNLSQEIIKKLQKYLADWRVGNGYHFIFELRASYSRFVGEDGAIEDIDIHGRNLVACTIDDAVHAAQEWESTLLNRIVLYSDQEIGHKRISVRPIYTIFDTHNARIAAGFIAFGDHRGVSTWVNQL